MKKLLIGALVGGLILFIWQFLSFGMFNLHGSQMAYTPNQDAVLELLESTGTEEGQFYLPMVPKGSTSEEFMALRDANYGKPWARVTYNKAFELNMPLNLFRGFVIDFLSALFICWILMKMTPLDFKTVMITCLAIGLIGYMVIPYLDSVWYSTNSFPELLDAVVGFGAVGAFLGWYLPRGEK